MPAETGNVTRVGVKHIQFYVPKKVSDSSACVFSPDDDFTVMTIDGVGLLFVRPDLSITLADVLAGLRPYLSGAPPREDGARRTAGTTADDPGDRRPIPELLDEELDPTPTPTDARYNTDD